MAQSNESVEVDVVAVCASAGGLSRTPIPARSLPHVRERDRLGTDRVLRRLAGTVHRNCKGGKGQTRAIC